ncbi:MAG: NnrU family protein [Alphaproteobacteria bacterium]
MTALVLAILTFMVSHVVLANAPARDVIVGRLGEGAFLALFAAVAAATLAWVVVAYGDAPYVELWARPGWARWVPIVVMPFAFVLIVAAYTTPNLSALRQDKVAEREDPAPGIMRVTRHPMMCSVALWAASHAIANGDAAGLVLTGGVLVLALGGMVLIDVKKRRRLGPAWARFATATSIVPFGAILGGRARFDWAGIGWWRVGLGLAAYAFFLLVHPWFAGVRALPG